MELKKILGEKVGMTQLVDDAGAASAVTIIKSQDCRLLKIIKSEDRGYSAVLLGYKDKKASRLSKPMRGVFSSLNSDAYSVLREFRVSNEGDVQSAEGDVLSVDQFQIGDKVSVRGKTIGRGFTGTIKRWKFRRGPMSHGSKNHRLVGSIGGGTTPGKVIKGKKMAGRSGNVYRSVVGLEVVYIDEKRGLMGLKGAVPGKIGNILEVTVR